MKITGDCPNCKKEVSIDIDKLDIKPPATLEVQNATTTQNATVQVQKVEPVEPEVQIKTVAPKDQPYFKCKNCGDAHKNPNYTEIPKFRCKNGNCNTLNGQKACKNCGNKDEDEFEEEDIDELKEIGIPEPEHADHKHEEE